MTWRILNTLWMSLSLVLLAACGDQPNANTVAKSDAKSQIVVTSRPLMLIAQEVTRGNDDISTVATSGDSHDAALTPGELKRIKDSELVLWLGAEAQPNLSKQLAGLNSIEPAQWVNLPDSRAHPGEKDPHFWFSSRQAIAYAQGLSETLSKMHPSRASVYAENLAQFKRRLAQIDQQSADMSGIKYLSTVDAYQSLEQQSGIEFDGALAEHDQPMKPSRLQQAASSSAKCVLASNPDQPQALGKFNWIVVDELMQGASSYTEGLSQALSLVQDCR